MFIIKVLKGVSITLMVISGTALGIFYSYLKWEVMSERFVNLFNPVSHFRVFISFIQQPLSWVFLIILALACGFYYYLEEKT